MFETMARDNTWLWHRRATVLKLDVCYEILRMRIISPFQFSASQIRLIFCRNCWQSLNPNHAVKMSSAKFLVCFKFQDTSKSFKVCENIVI